MQEFHAASSLTGTPFSSTEKGTEVTDVTGVADALVVVASVVVSAVHANPVCSVAGPAKRIVKPVAVARLTA